MDKTAMDNAYNDLTKLINAWLSDDTIHNVMKTRHWINDVDTFINEHDNPSLNNATSNYSDDNIDMNNDIFNWITYSTDYSAQEKLDALKDLKWKIQWTRMDRLNKAGNDINLIKAASEENKKSDELYNKTAKWTDFTRNQKLSYQWLTPNKSNELLNQIKTIYTSDISDKDKKKKIEKIIRSTYSQWQEHNDMYYNYAYKNKSDDTLSQDQLNEKNMLKGYKTNWDNFYTTASAYLNWLWWWEKSNALSNIEKYSNWVYTQNKVKPNTSIPSNMADIINSLD